MDFAPSDSDGDIENEFVRTGLVRLPGAVDLGPGSRLGGMFRWTLRQAGLADVEGLRCPRGLTSLPPTRVADMRLVAPRLWETVCRLVGGTERVRAPARIGNALLCNYRTTVLRESWHVDGDFFVHYPDSPEQALLVFVLWSDVRPGEGATLVVPSATAAVLEHLAASPEGRTSGRIPAGRFVAATGDGPRELTGRAGDAWILHPLTVHQSAPNPHGEPRFVSNPVVALEEPLRLAGDGPRSPLERLTRRLLGRDYLPPASVRRETFTPERIGRWSTEGVYTDEEARPPAPARTG